MDVHVATRNIPFDLVFVFCFKLGTSLPCFSATQSLCERPSPPLPSLSPLAAARVLERRKPLPHALCYYLLFSELTLWSHKKKQTALVPLICMANACRICIEYGWGRCRYYAVLAVWWHVQKGTETCVWSTNLYKYEYIHVHLRLYKRMNIFIHIYMYMYIPTYIYMYTYICIHTHICICLYVET